MPLYRLYLLFLYLGSLCVAVATHPWGWPAWLGGRSVSGSGNFVTVPRPAVLKDSFTSVVIKLGGCHVTVHVVAASEQEAVVIHAEDNIEPWIEVTVSHNVLCVDRIAGSMSCKRLQIDLYFTQERIDGVYEWSATNASRLCIEASIGSVPPLLTESCCVNQGKKVMNACTIPRELCPAIRFNASCAATIECLGAVVCAQLYVRAATAARISLKEVMVKSIVITATALLDALQAARITVGQFEGPEALLTLIAQEASYITIMEANLHKYAALAESASVINLSAGMIHGPAQVVHEVSSGGSIRCRLMLGQDSGASVSKESSD